MPGHLHVLPGPGGGAGAVPHWEAFFIGLLLTLAILAILLEVLRRADKPGLTSRRQFWLRMFGGGVMLLLVGLITFGVLFTRPSDGRIFGWYWAFCSLVLLGMIIILRQDVASTTRAYLDERLRMRDERLKELQEMAENWRQSGQPTNLAPDPSRLESSQDSQESRGVRGAPGA